jgi:hypothetical protein
VSELQSHNLLVRSKRRKEIEKGQTSAGKGARVEQMIAGPHGDMIWDCAAIRALSPEDERKVRAPQGRMVANGDWGRP